MRVLLACVIVLLIGTPGALIFLYYYCGAVGPGNQDYVIKIFGGYELVRFDSRTREIIADERLFDPSGVTGFGRTVVPADVVRLGWNSRYIACVQSDRSTEATPTLNWWVIDVEKRAVFGPMAEDEYRNRLAEPPGSESIQIRPVDTYPRKFD